MILEDRGFTLIEIVLALTIMFFVSAALLAVFINSQFLNWANSNLAVAVSHAQYALEEKKAINFPALPVGTETWNSATLVSKNLIPLDSESVVITITNVAAYTKDIIATVNWRDRGMINRSIALETLRTGQ